MFAHTTDPAPPGPYGTHATTYHAHGWAPLPLPAGQKKHPPKGWTGYDGDTPSPADVHAWTETHPGGNIALRLPPDVLGLDVDAYDDKIGGPVLTELERTLGALPATWRSTSRDDGTSGIRLFRIPPHLRWPTEAGPGIELIRHEHRYMVVWPSIHPNGGTYRWINPTGTVALADIPHVDDLPDLPEAWVQHYTRGEKAGEHLTAGMDDTAAHHWLDNTPAGHPCDAMHRALNRALEDLTTSGARHDHMLRATNRLAWIAGAGHPGLQTALDTYQGAWLQAVAGDRGRDEAMGEWDRAVTGAADRAAAGTTRHHTDPCTDPFHGLIAKENPPCPSSAPSVDASAPPPTPTTPDATNPAAPDGTAPPGTTTTASKGLSPSASAPATDTATLNSGSGSSNTPDTDDALELEIRRQQLIHHELEQQRARRAAQRLLATEERDLLIADRVEQLELNDQATRQWKIAAAGAQEPPAPLTLAELLATPDDPIRYRVADLWPAGGRVVLAAPAKAGKSTAVTNLVKSLADGTPYLGRYDVVPVTGRVVVIDNELDPRQIKHNYAAQGVQATDKVGIIPLRGKVATFDITDPNTRAEWAEKLRAMDAQVVIFDCLRPLIDAIGLSEDKDAGRVLVAFDALLADAGVSDGMVVHHMGHSGERSRGDTRIRDWPDAEWKIVKKKNEHGDSADDAERFFSAFGRDVHVPESRLLFDGDEKALTLAEGTRADLDAADDIERLLELLEVAGGFPSGNQFQDAARAAGIGRNEFLRARDAGVRQGLIIETKTGSGRTSPASYTLSTDPLRHFSTTSPPPSGEVGKAGSPVPPRRGTGAGEVNGQANDQRFSGKVVNRLCPCGAPIDDVRVLAGKTTCTEHDGHRRHVDGGLIDPATGKVLS